MLNSFCKHLIHEYDGDNSLEMTLLVWKFFNEPTLHAYRNILLFVLKIEYIWNRHKSFDTHLEDDCDGSHIPGIE